MFLINWHVTLGRGAGRFGWHREDGTLATGPPPCRSREEISLWGVRTSQVGCRIPASGRDQALTQHPFPLTHRFYSVLNQLGLYNKNAKILFLVRQAGCCAVHRGA